MTGKIQIKLGDIFNGTSDLIVLPCSATGTITQFVYNKLKQFDIPLPPKDMKLGDLTSFPFEGAENFAQYVAYAVSVHNNFSDLKEIRRIGEQLGKLTLSNSAIQIIHVPLLGAGAGGLRSENVIEELKNGFLMNSSVDARLIVHVLHETLFNRLTEYFKGNISPQKINEEKEYIRETVRVFISYTRTNENHQQWVQGLGEFLRENGINARLDVWHLKTGMDLPQFMTNELSLADKVIIISNEQYAEKANGRLGGVGWETMIIQGDMASIPPESTKYITVVKEDEFEKGIPTFLKTKYAIHWGSQQKDSINKQRLLTDLLNIQKAPPLGIAPIYI